MVAWFLNKELNTMYLIGELLQLMEDMMNLQEKSNGVYKYRKEQAIWDILQLLSAQKGCSLMDICSLREGQGLGLKQLYQSVMF